MSFRPSEYKDQQKGLRREWLGRNVLYLADSGGVAKMTILDAPPCELLLLQTAKSNHRLMFIHLSDPS